MKKEYGYILIAYIIMQLSGLIGYPLVYKLGVSQGMDPATMQELTPGYWLVSSFTLTLLVIWLIMRRSTFRNKIEQEAPLPLIPSVFWAIAGVFLALFSQRIAIAIESMLGIEMGSENTENIMNIIETVPITMIVASIIGPILEEIVFRKIIFGSLYGKFSFAVSALISSAIFAIAHMELEHILLYSAMGFTFAYLYVKTKRLIVPIIAHVSMNTLVVIVQYVYGDEMQRMIDEAERIQNFIMF
ncbi:MAG TPA: CPBP family intramembrane glutamic endopeptidase [Chondromyces sp.]|nr:CPBP family intramembrane glutamic endopeptidase [Chondromyces sp.]